MAKNNAHSFKNMLTVAKKSPQLQFHSNNNRPVSNSDTWNEALHPRHPAGNERGGEFAPKDKGQQIAELRKKKEGIIKKFDELAALKKKLYSNMDIESPKSIAEKQLDKELQFYGSQMNDLVMQIRKLK